MITKTWRCEKNETLPAIEAIGSAGEHISFWKGLSIEQPRLAIRELSGVFLQCYGRPGFPPRWHEKPKKEAARIESTNSDMTGNWRPVVKCGLAVYSASPKRRVFTLRETARIDRSSKVDPSGNELSTPKIQTMTVGL
jgi:hypothetical protein